MLGNSVLQIVKHLPNQKRLLCVPILLMVKEMLCEMFWSAKEVDHAAWDGSPFVIPEALVLGSTQGRTPEEKVRFRLEMYCSEEADGRRGVSDFESASV